MNFENKLIPGIFIKRYKRFFTDIRVKNKIITAHCPNTGSMLGLLNKGNKTWITKSNNLNRKLKYFIQVNIAHEIQKSGIPVNELDAFYNYCVNEINLKIIGLMLIPPNNENPEKYFKSLNELNKSLALENMSMGMSADYLEAIKHGSTFVRVGSSIFGSRS